MRGRDWSFSPSKPEPSPNSLFCLSWTPDGQILAAGIKGVSGNCPPESENPCLQGFGVAEIDPDTLKTRTLFDNNGRALINGVSIALEAGECNKTGDIPHVSHFMAAVEFI